MRRIERMRRIGPQRFRSPIATSPEVSLATAAREATRPEARIRAEELPERL
jgi:hypothetical protein